MSPTERKGYRLLHVTRVAKNIDQCTFNPYLGYYIRIMGYAMPFVVSMSLTEGL